VVAVAFGLGSIALAVGLDAGRLSWLVAVVGNILAMYIEHREDQDHDGNLSRVTGARWYIGFAVIAAGGLLSVAFYPGWDALGVIVLFGCAAMALRPLLLDRPPSPGS
jgi:hypothetical protein